MFLTQLGCCRRLVAKLKISSIHQRLNVVKNGYITKFSDYKRKKN